MAHFEKRPGRMKTIIFILTIITLAACQTSTENRTGQVTEDTIIFTETFSESQKPEFHEVSGEFAAYLKNFRKTDLPVAIKGCVLNYNGLAYFDGTKYIQFNEDYSYAYSQIPTNGNYVATITLGLADCLLPVLTTYKPDGRIIDRKTIAIGYCGSDCGYSCEEFMSISKDFNIYTSDTISTYDCDSLGYEIPGTYKYYVIYKEGKLQANGKIQLSEEMKKPLKGRKNEP